MDYTTKRLAEKLYDIVCGHRIISINETIIVLDNDVELELYESAQDCCATAYGNWNAVNGLEAIITKVTFESTYREGDETSTTTGIITFLHNQNPIVQGQCYADDGNGYYFSVLSLRVKINGEIVRDLEVINA